MLITSEANGIKIETEIRMSDVQYLDWEGGSIWICIGERFQTLLTFTRSGLDWSIPSDSLFELQDYFLSRNASPLYVMDLLETLADKIWWDFLEPILRCDNGETSI